MKFLIIISAIAFIVLIIRLFRNPIHHWLLHLRGKLKIYSLKQAIKQADEDKQETGRKNIVVMNLGSGKFEPIQKKILKQASNAAKNKNNAKMTEGRKKFFRKKKRVFDDERIKTMEKKSLYVTE